MVRCVYKNTRTTACRLRLHGRHNRTHLGSATAQKWALFITHSSTTGKKGMLKEAKKNSLPLKWFKNLVARYVGNFLSTELRLIHFFVQLKQSTKDHWDE